MTFAYEMEELVTSHDRVVGDMERWLVRDPGVNLACDMYIGDCDDSRWALGHSSQDYYVKKDERATADLVMRELNVRADNLVELGVGGVEAVRENTFRMARKIGAQRVYALDLAPDLAETAAHLVETELGMSGEAVICDMFEPLPDLRLVSNSLVSGLGLEIGNLETYDREEDLEARLTTVFSHYADAVRTADRRLSANHLLISYDANRDVRETRACYANPEFGGLVRSLVERWLGDTAFFDYDVVVRPMQDVDFLSTGLRANRNHVVRFNGKAFSLKKGEFFPVLNSSRFAVPFMTKAVERAGWSSHGLWSATGRVHYHHFIME